MSIPRISICVLNRNGVDRLHKTVNSIVNQDCPNLEILYLDNGSTDESLAYLQDISKNIKIIKKPSNQGYGASKNELVLEASGEYVLLLDNDIELVGDNFITKLFQEYAMLKDVAFISPIIKDVDKDYIRSLGLSYNRIQPTYQYKEALDLGTVPVAGFLGGAVFFKRSLFVDLGLYDEKYPINIDDYDMSARACLMGYKNYITSKVSTIHHGIEVNTSVVGISWRYKYYFAGFTRMMIKNYSFKNLLIWFPLSVAWILLKTCKQAVKYRSFKPVFGTLTSMALFIKDLPDSLRQRKYLQSIRKSGIDIYLNI
jgi:GT2 family glycosyltransferase